MNHRPVGGAGTESQTIGTLVSIQVGRPVEKLFAHPVDDKEAVWTSGIDKRIVSGPVALHETNLDGDGQADLQHHGGPHRAVLAYSADHYPRWIADWQGGLQSELTADSAAGGTEPGVSGSHVRTPFDSYGAFGENLTMAGFSEDNSCIGDILHIGDVVLQVSQPRLPCWKLGRKHGLANLPTEVEKRGWTGWYLRVLKTGVIEAGMSITLVERLYPQWTIREVHRILRARKSVPDEAEKLATCPELSPDWQTMLSGQ